MPFFPRPLVNAIARNHQKKLRRLGNLDSKWKKDILLNDDGYEIDENGGSNQISLKTLENVKGFESNKNRNVEWLQKLLKMATKMAPATALKEGYTFQGLQRNYGP